ncbi:hypothetical protein D6777_01715 [Candidatus Woesearchaeota archaeon]|nr:MAG: hypothetical protein D6777_01715 [Candidatus Woesearchaeota archaeon]
MVKKRGQITIFVILGIVILATIILLISFRKEIIPPSSQTSINAQMKEVKQIVESCLENSAKGPIEKIALQGGYLSPSQDTFRLWNDTPISYLCFNIEDQDYCRNRLLTLQNMESQLSKAIEESLPECLDFDNVRGVNIKTKGKPKVSVQILPLQVLVDLEYPVTVESKVSDAKASTNKFSYIVDKPLGDLYNVAQDILDQETTTGQFDQLTYMLLKLGKYTIYVQKPYPDKIYRLKLREDNFMFQFAVQGEPS